MKQLIYRFIYSEGINRVIRNINKLLSPILPAENRIPPSGTIRVKTVSGNNLRIKTNQTNYPTHLIFWEGYQNFEYTPIFTSLVQKIDLFYDIGSNIGYYSLLAATENRRVKVVGFEPAPGPLFYFRENVRINNFQNIKIEELALSEKEGEITFYEVRNSKYSYLEHNLAGESNAGSKTTGKNFVPISVRTTTLDAYIRETNEELIDLIKIDTEGTEHLILSSSRIVLEKMKPIIICETLFNTIEPELESIFSTYGYEFFNHTPEGLQKVDTIIRESDNGVRNCFFVHPSKYHLVEEFVC